MKKYYLWVLLLVMLSCNTKNFKEITPEGVKFPGLKDCTKTNINVLVTHGMGITEDFTHFDFLIEGIAKELEYDFVKQEEFMYPDDDYSKCLELDKPDALGGKATLIIKEFQKQEANRTRHLRFYTVFWSDITQAAKEWLITHDEHKKKKQLNLKGKNLVVNEGISDVVLYNGGFRGLMQLPFVFTIDRMIATNPFSRRPGLNVNPLENYANFIISGSFGSKIILDVLNNSNDFEAYVQGVDKCLKRVDSSVVKINDLDRIIGSLDNKDIDSDGDGSLPRQFYRNLDRIYLLSNQIPLFGLEDLTPNNTTKEIERTVYNNSWPGISLAPSKTEQLNIIAFSDPNDFLGYALPEDETQSIINTRMNFGRKHYFILVNPLQAHEDSRSDKRTVELIVNGYNSEDEE